MGPLFRYALGIYMSQVGILDWRQMRLLRDTNKIGRARESLIKGHFRLSISPLGSPSQSSSNGRIIPSQMAGPVYYKRELPGFTEAKEEYVIYLTSIVITILLLYKLPLPTPPIWALLFGQERQPGQAKPRLDLRAPPAACCPTVPPRERSLLDLQGGCTSTALSEPRVACLGACLPCFARAPILLKMQ